MIHQPYPTKSALRKIRRWPVENGFKELMEFVHINWAFSDWGWYETKRRYYISTAGWSGNEDIIGALKKNYIFWALCWVQSRRGGHYIFEKKRVYGKQRKNR